MKPRLLDLFCGAGGAAMGYHRAGFEVVGVDLRPQPHYPFEFHQGDALTWPLDGFDAIHASPPCQGYSTAVVSDGRWDRTRGVNEPRLIEPLRARFCRMGTPYVIENVQGAWQWMAFPARACGTMFGLPIARHRLFESSEDVWFPTHPDCTGVARAYAEVHGWDYRDMTVTGKGRRAGTSERWSEIMGIDWPMTQHELREAIPPAYTEWIGAQLLAALERVA